MELNKRFFLGFLLIFSAETTLPAAMNHTREVLPCEYSYISFYVVIHTFGRKLYPSIGPHMSLIN
jgi:hypothetical protein